MTEPPPGQRVIFNADDFGRSASINEAVIRAHRGGVLTTASLMVNGAACGEAVELARLNPNLGVGLHLTLVDGRSTLPCGQIPGLVHPPDRFDDNAVAAGMRCFFDRSLRAQLEAEISAQIEKFQATALPLDHVNGHLNFHLHPVVFDVLLGLFGRRRANPVPVGADARRRCSSGSPGPGDGLLASAPDNGDDRATGVSASPAVRLTRDPFWLNARLAGGQWFYRATHAFIFLLLSGRARGRMRKHGIRRAPWVFGLLQNGRMDEAYLLKLLPVLPAGDVEIYAHPNLDEFRHELDALVSPHVIALTKKLGIRRVRYQDL
jgi:chitin disaccharide deacetylase